MFSSTFELHSDIFTAIFRHLFFFEEMEPMYVIHKISIATVYDIIQFGDDVNIYPVY